MLVIVGMEKFCNLPYEPDDPSDTERCYDLFLPDRTSALLPPLVVFVHG